MQKTVTIFDVERVRKDFPLLKTLMNNKPLIYLDNASTTQKPHAVIESISQHYLHTNANIHRGVYKLSEEATTAYENVRHLVAKFINAKYQEIIFTRNTTESLNLLAYSLGSTLKPGDEIVLTEMEHHSNLVPWQQIGKERKAIIKFIPLTKEGRIDIDAARKIITDRTKIVAMTHISNVLGVINPIKQIGKIVHDHGSLFIVDGAQAAGHMPIDVNDLGCDFYAFSSHKMFGPTGVGVLYGKKELLEKMKPFLYGGEMIREVTYENSSWNDVPWKFEAGTQHIAGVVGLGAAIHYLTSLGMNNIQQYEEGLTEYALEKLSSIPDVVIHGPATADQRVGVISFSLGNIHSHDVAAILDREGIAVRGGHHCAMPLMKKLSISGSTRISLAFYNTHEEIDKAVEALKKARKVFNL